MKQIIIMFLDMEFSLWSGHQNIVQETWKLKKKRMTLDIEDTSPELSVYLRMPPPGRLGDNPFKIWREISQPSSNLYQIARKYLSVVGTSVPAERLFSKAGEVISAQRSRLKPQHANKLIFLSSLESKFWN